MLNERKGDLLANKTNDMAHTKWLCKYHIVFTPKYRRKVIYNQYRKDLRDIIKTLCGMAKDYHVVVYEKLYVDTRG